MTIVVLRWTESFSKDLWEIIEDSFAEPPKVADEAWTAKDQDEYNKNVKRNATALMII